MKLGASIFPRKIIPIEESLEYFENNKYIDYMEIFHDLLDGVYGDNSIPGDSRSC